MIKQDYLLRMIQEIVSALVQALLKRKEIAQAEWNEYERIARQVLDTDLPQLQAMTAEEILSLYQTDTDKIELSAVMMLKMAEDCKNNLVLSSKLRQDGLSLLQYVQKHGKTYSLQREMLIAFLTTNG